ncbi:hypothetical protein MCNF_52550 [Mycolicibacterium confluentis]|uniref:Uncharacterized protein n=1 Tax=Mycolicibacterium confluentis TaxID=28047 RepID=A0A7I7Y4W5_9MYCO|nr:hypothetical protein MCNF_52550 [Mycolicibacterium confluentis]
MDNPVLGVATINNPPGQRAKLVDWLTVLAQFLPGYRRGYDRRHKRMSVTHLTWGQDFEHAGQDQPMTTQPLGPQSAQSSHWSSSTCNRSYVLALLRAGVVALVLMGVLALIVLF